MRALQFLSLQVAAERGGWWADADMICLQAFDFPDEFVFGSEISKGLEVLGSSVFKAPAGSDVMAYAWGVCQTKTPEHLVWGETGPRLIDEAVRKFGLEKHAQPPYVFSPLGFWEWQRVLEPDGPPALRPETRAFIFGMISGGRRDRIRMQPIPRIVFMSNSGESI